jgi:hypothetical protein
MEVLRAGSLLAATLSMGLVAGVFALYAHTIMPGLGRTDDRTFVGAFQSIDRAIINPWFIGGGFFGALVCTIVAGIAQLGRDGLPWVTAALVLYGQSTERAGWGPVRERGSPPSVGPGCARRAPFQAHQLEWGGADPRVGHVSSPRPCRSE